MSRKPGVALATALDIFTASEADLHFKEKSAEPNKIV
jgi:hypothetical protein